MPAPVARRMCVPFHLARHARHEDDAAKEDEDNNNKTKTLSPLQLAAETPSSVVYIYIHLVGFGTRYVWLHISTGPGADGAASGFGACTMAMPTTHVGRAEMSVASTPLLHYHTLNDNSRRSDEQGLAANTVMQESFATHLAEQLTRRLLRERGDKAVAMAVNCAVDGTQAELLLGTTSGQASPCTVAFGHCVMHQCLRLVRDYLASV